MKHVTLFVNPVWDPTGERRDQHHHPRRQIVKGFDHGSLKPFKGSPKSDHGSLSSVNHYLSAAAFASAEELFNLIVFRSSLWRKILRTSVFFCNKEDLHGFIHR